MVMVLGAMICILSAFACGGSSSTGPSSSTGDGRIYLENASTNAGRYKADIQVSYFNEILNEQVEMVVLPGEKKDISKVVLPKGTKVKLTLRGKAYVYSHQMDQEIEVTVDGDLIIRVNSYNWDNIGRPIDYVILKA